MFTYNTSPYSFFQKDLFSFILCVLVFAFMCVCAPCIYLVLWGAKRGPAITGARVTEL